MASPAWDYVRAQADSEWSDYEGDDDADIFWQDSDDDDHLGGQELLCRSSAAGSSFAGSEAGSSNACGSMPARSIGGRPWTVKMSDDTLRWLCREEYSNAVIATYFGTTVAAVDHRSRALALTVRLAHKAGWSCRPPLA